MYQPYQCCVKSFEDYYIAQAGKGLSYYQAIPLQKGYSLGGLFRSLFRAAVSLFKQGAKTLGKQALSSGVDLVPDVVHGKDVKASAKQRAKEAGHLLTDKAANKVKQMLGSGIKRTVKKRISPAKVKKLARDIFDS